MQRSVSSTTSLVKEGQALSTDEVFTKHTFTEVKVIQSRLRADADAKKEELRQMVGERYRDLLQASSSIISIAKSSKRIVAAVEESREAIQNQEDPPLPKTSSLNNIQDRHLHALQVLAAHMKLLLDAPEHLWRLIERKKFFPASWLFLLARVIHRALLQKDEQEEESWTAQGVDVLAEFPLIQRQWDVISQFRPQIIHRATLSLRDAASSIEETCATLVTLHLLDSRPLHDTLSTMLSQRSRTLNVSLENKVSAGPSIITSSISRGSGNGNAVTFSLTQDSTSNKATKTGVCQAKDSLHDILDIVSQTMYTARGIFDRSSGNAMIESVLEFISSDSQQTMSIPTNLQLTTRTLLMNVTSNAHFQLLPQNLQSYKPYIDLTSSSASLRQDQFTNQLNEWFNQAMKLFQDAVKKWFLKLETVKDAWGVRLASRKWVEASALEEVEKVKITEIVDNLCRERVVEIWRTMLKSALIYFESALENSLTTIGEPEHEPEIDFTFNIIPLPMLSQSSTNYDLPIRKYQTSLKQQLVGRTALLDSVLGTLERCARHIHEELAYMRSGIRSETTSIVDILTRLYAPSAEDLTKASISSLEKVVGETSGDDESAVRKLVFLGHVTEDLGTRSSFIEHIGCGKTAHDGFLDKLSATNHRILDIWKQKIVQRAVCQVNPSLRVIPTSLSISGPTPDLVQALLSLFETLHQVTFKWNHSKQIDIIQDTLSLFVETWITEKHGRKSVTRYDVALLRTFAKLVGKPKAMKSLDLLEQALKETQSDLCHDDPEDVALEYVRSLQTFFPATLNPVKTSKDTSSADKFPNLLRYGQPSMEHHHLQTSLDLAKPGPRFGLLLVGGENNQ